MAKRSVERVARVVKALKLTDKQQERVKGLVAQAKRDVGAKYEGGADEDDLQQAVDAMVAEFRCRRDAFCAGLNQVPGFRCPLPGGAFYAFPNITGTGMKSKELADHLLYDAGIACLSGAAFGEYGEGYIRFSYANSYENLMDAVERIKEAVGNRAGVGTR